MLQNPAGVGPPPPPPAANQQWLMMQQQQQQQPPPQMMQPQQQVMHMQPQSVMQHHQPQGVMQQQQFMQPHTQDEIKTLWVGDLQYWMDESYLHNCFAHTGEVFSVKIIRNKQTGYSEGYGFIEFATHATAEKILQSYQGSQMPQTEQPFRLNWASSGSGEKRPETGPEHSIFVGDLAPDVTDFVLQETFRSRYPSVQGAKVVIDVLTGCSKGYGFVRFNDELERIRAMTEMNGVYCSNRPMRISTATPRKSLAPGQQGNYKASFQGSGYGAPRSQNFSSDNDPNNTTVFVGGLDHNVMDEELKQVFSQYGEISYVKIPVGKGCGFIQFTTRASAEEALQKLHGTVLGQQTIRLSWGRSSTNKQPASGWGQPQQDSNQFNGGYYGYGQTQQGQGYDGYGYAVAPQDPGTYAQGSYPQYGAYPQQVSQ
ncbi:hypothetical protein O6H91_07G053300 [Diphasiastrum complanatum]|uniref:Uncharacterized protein n=1 Tax=Diphasiastrum complanatum TaxID=34168 RepID=A0ACC2D5B7_DIPCM|nr:hypothetical protein O6H91_07G053300 [Diphasiastrum complanatum]